MERRRTLRRRSREMNRRSRGRRGDQGKRPEVEEI